MPPKHKSGAEKRKKRKRENELIESQKGALNRYFTTASSVDVNDNNERQESELGQDEDRNSNVAQFLLKLLLIKSRVM